MRPTARQQAYLNFIRDYIALHRQSPAETDMAMFFRVTPPSVHQMVVALTEKGLITRQPGQARSIRLAEVPAIRAVPDADAWRPTRPPDDITAPLDPEIAALVEALREEPAIATKGSCWGHERESAYIEFAIEGIEGLRWFVERVNLVDRKIRSSGGFEILLNWSEEVLTACSFDVFPNWIMLAWEIKGRGRGDSPSAALLAKVTKLWRATAKLRGDAERG